MKIRTALIATIVASSLTLLLGMLAYAAPSFQYIPSVNCALTAAAGAGQTEANGSIDTTSCWATETGVQRGTGYTEAQIVAGQSDLTTVNGNVTITVPGTVINREYITGCVAIDANNVEIVNSLIRTTVRCEGGDRGTDPSAINNGHYTVFGTLVQDTTVDGMSAGDNLSRGIFLGYGSTCLRCQAIGFVMDSWGDGSATEPTEFYDSYFHGLDDTWAAIGSPSTPHENAMYLNSSAYVRVEHDYVSSVRAGGSVTGAISFLGSYGPANHDTVDSSYAEGGSGADLTWSCGTNDVTTNTAISSDAGYGGTIAVERWKDLAGDTWSGNFVPETGAAFADPSPSDC